MRDIATPAPPTTPANRTELEFRRLRNREAFLDGKILMAARILKARNIRFLGTVVEPDRGMIKLPPVKQYLPQSSDEHRLTQAVSQKIVVSTEKAQIVMAQIRNESPVGIITTRIIDGVVVVLYNSSKTRDFRKPKILDLNLTDEEFGSFSPETSSRAPIIAIDLNENLLRPEGYSPSEVLLHELGHYHVELIMQSLREQSDLGMRSLGFSTNTDGILQDWIYYKALIDRAEFPGAEVVNIYQQRHYLDEAHASFFGKQMAYFNLNARVYNNIKNGAHTDLVGLDPVDQQMAREIVGFCQAAFLIDKTPFGSSATWQDFSMDLTAILGTSLTVRQARRLIGKAWNNFLLQDAAIIDRPENADTIENAITQMRKQQFGFIMGIRGILGFPPQRR
jgi:hypothetical protein